MSYVIPKRSSRNRPLARWRVLAVLLSLPVWIAASEASALDRSYTYTELKDIWVARIGPPQALWYSEALFESALVPAQSFSTTEPATVSQDNGFGDVLQSVTGLGNTYATSTVSEVDSETETRVYYHFFVVYLPKEYAGQIASREMGLHFYLQREASYQGVSDTDIQDADPNERLQILQRVQMEQKELARRARGAQLEILLIRLARYLEAPTAESKCARLFGAIEIKTALDEILEGLGRDPATDGFVTDDLPAGWGDLAPLFAQARQRFAVDFAEQHICQLQPTLSSAEHRQQIAQQANDAIQIKLYGGLDDSGVPLDGIVPLLTNEISSQQATLQGYIQSINDIDPLTGQLLETERNLGDTRSNLELVYHDSFLVDQKLTDLEAELGPGGFADFEGFEDLSTYTPPAIGEVEAKLADLQAAIHGFLEHLDRAGTYAPLELPDCAGLASEYDNNQGVDLLSDLTGCLGQIQTYVEATAPLDEWEKAGNAFAYWLQELSDNVLEKLLSNF